ncbi:helix-turn-helix transcriptional regulator [Paenibacillus sp. HJGM_3]|uniref:helix-turn-helix transcriptional regulator n=1 Tax=Paenibacillus sp. HJGM_3 TaxID=3379816 RepID=UPI00385D311F
MAFRVGRVLLNPRLKERGLTQEDLARHMKVSQSYISQIARNKKPLSLEFARNVAHFIGCEVNDLVIWEWVDEDEEGE